MKFVYFGYDFMLPSVFRLIEDGHEILGIMSFECDNVFNFNQACRKLAQSKKIPFIQSPASPEHIAEFEDQGCTLFLSAGYAHKIPQHNIQKSKAVNIHPTYLPKARGMMPLPHIIMNNITEAAGLTAHKMTQHFDAGDILTQQKINLSPRETVESYTAKIAVHAPNIISDLVENLDNYWKSASPQKNEDATYFKPPTDQDRTLDWSHNVADIDKIARAFGRFGSIATFDNRLWVIYAHDYWQEPHEHPTGTIAAMAGREIVIAAKDGYILLKEFEEARL